MFGRKKKRQQLEAARQAELAANAKLPEWEYYNVTAGEIGGSGSKEITETINRMQAAGWEFVNQSAGERGALHTSQTNLLFRRPYGTKGAPPVGPNVVGGGGCCMVWTILPAAVAAVAAVPTWRAMRGKRPRRA